MSSNNIRKVILKNADNIQPVDFVGVLVGHPSFGKGRIINCGSKCRRVTVKYEEGNTSVKEELSDLLGADSACKFSTRQLEAKFGHLRQHSQPVAEKFIGLFPWRVTTPPQKSGESLTSQVWPYPKKVVRRGPPEGMKPLFKIAGH